MITVTMEQIIDFRNNSGVFSNSQLPLKGAYKINKIRKAIEKEEDFYTEKFQEIVNKYAKRDEEGNFIFNEDGDQIIIQEDKLEDCNKELFDLQELQVQVENYHLTIEDLGEELKCTPDELNTLMPFMD